MRISIVQYSLCVCEFHAIEMVTLIPRLPLSANNCAIDVSNTKQSELRIAEDTPSCMDLGIASHVRRLLCPFNSNLEEKTTHQLGTLLRNAFYAGIDTVTNIGIVPFRIELAGVKCVCKLYKFANREIIISSLRNG